MDNDDEFGDLYSDVLPPFQPPVVLPPPPTHLSIDLNLRSQDQDVTEADSASVSRVSPNEASKLSVILEATRNSIGDGDEKDVSFDIEEPDVDSTPVIPGLAVDRNLPEDTARIEQAGDGDYVGGGEGDWDSDSEDDLQIVLNESSRNVMIGSDRRSIMRDNEFEDDDDDDDDEEPLVIVADTDSNQLMKDHIFGEDGLQAVDGDGKDGGEAAKGSGPGGAAGTAKSVYNSQGYHHNAKYKYIRQGAAPIPGGAVSIGANPSGQIRPPANLGPMAGRGRGDWRPLGMRNVSAGQKGFHQAWGSTSAGRGLDFTLPSHKTIFEVDVETFEEKPWRHPGVDISDYFNFGLNEESWKEYCKQLDQRRIETTMQSKIYVYESGRTDKGYDPDLPPELAAATGAQVQVDTSNLVKLDTVQGDSAKVPANIRPSLPPGRPIPVDMGSGERLPSADTRPPRMRDLDAIIEIVCEDFHEDEPSGENAAEQADSSLPGENVAVENSYDNSRRPGKESAERSPSQDEPSKRPKKQDDEISRSTDGGQSFRSSSPVRDGTRSSNDDREDVGGESDKDVEMKEEIKMSSAVPRSAAQEDNGEETKTESSENSKTRSGSQKDYQQLKDGAEEEVIHDKHNVQPASNRKQHDNNATDRSRKNQDRGKETERTRVASKSGRENSNSHMEIDSGYNHSIARGEDFNKRRDRDVDGGFWRRKEDDPYNNRRGGDEGSRKRDREDYRDSRKRVKLQENETHDHIPLRKHLDYGGMRNSYEEVDDHISKRRKDEEYTRRSRAEKNETSYGQRERETSRLKRDDKLEHQKRDVQNKARDDFDDHRHRDGNEKLRERENSSDKLKVTNEESLSSRGRVRGHKSLEDRSSRMKDEYKDNLSRDSTRHTKQTKKREYTGEESSSHHHRGHEDEKKTRQEEKSDTKDPKHKDPRRKIKEERDGTDSLRRKQGEQNGCSEVITGTKEGRNGGSEIPQQQPEATRKRKENPCSGDEQLQDLKKGRTKLERWGSHKERDDAVAAAKPSPSSSSSVFSKLQEKERSTNQEVTAEKSVQDVVEKGPPRDQNSDTVEKLKKRSARFKLPMPTENKDTTGVKKMETETLPSSKTEGPAVDLEVKSERPARKRRWTSN